MVSELLVRTTTQYTPPELLQIIPRGGAQHVAAKPPQSTSPPSYYPPSVHPPSTTARAVVDIERRDSVGRIRT